MSTLVSGDSDAAGDERPTLVAETNPDFAPFDYTVGTEVVGIDMDILRAVCDDMGYNIEFRFNSFDSIIMSVEQGKCDIGANGFTISEERAKRVLFSDPYAFIHQVVVAPVGTDIETLEDVKGKVISVETGTTGADYAETVTDKVIFQKSYADIVNDVITGKADCEIVDSTVAMSQISSQPGKLVMLDILTDSPKEEYGFLFNKADTALCDSFNASFQKIKDNGTYDDIMSYYLQNGYTSNTPSYFSDQKIVVNTVPSYPPFEYIYEDMFTGIDMDIVKALFKEMDSFRLVKESTFENIFDAVADGECDMAASGLTITDERKDMFLFSDPYAEVHQVLVVKESSNYTLADLAGLTLTTQKDTSSSKCIYKYSDKVSLYDTYGEALEAVLNGEADCEVVDNISAQSQVATTPGLKVLDILKEESEYYGFLFSKDNQELCDRVNAALNELKHNGMLADIFDYYAKYDFQQVESYFDSQEYADQAAEEEDQGFWASLMDKFYTDFIKNDRYMYIFDGLKNTLIITVLALIMGLVLGTVVAMVRSIHDQTGKLKILNSIGVLYTTVIRGTPVMVQLMLIYYVIFATSELNSVLIASVAFGLNSGAYVAEVVRAGITAVPKGQMEACRSLGMSNRQAMTSVILPQAVRNILPALGNEGISLLKETSVAGYIGIMDLTRGADIIRGQTYDALLPMLVAAVIYLAIVLVLAHLIKRMEKRLNDAY